MVMVARFVEVSRRKGLKVNPDKSKQMEEGWSLRSVWMEGDWRKFKYLGYILDESGTDVVKYRREIASRRKVTGTIRSLGN